MWCSYKYYTFERSIKMKTYNIIFSPTGGTAKIADAISKHWPRPELIDLSKSTYCTKLEEDALALIAMPCFGGLAPQLALDRLAKITANHAKCALVAVYGNRAYDDMLIQMKDYAEKAGFQVIAAVSAVAEHSIVHAYAAGRPNAKDQGELCAFGEKILDKAANAPATVSVPGNSPYKKPGSAMVPKASSACTSCGLCAQGCPAGGIDPAKPRITDKAKCIGCMRCVSICPAKARGINPVMTKIAGLALKKACSQAKANELFI